MKDKEKQERRKKEVPIPNINVSCRITPRKINLTHIIEWNSSHLRCACLKDVMTTPALLEQCDMWSCCIDGRDEMVLSETPPNEPRGVAYIDVDMSSSLSEKRLECFKVIMCVSGRCLFMFCITTHTVVVHVVECQKCSSVVSLGFWERKIYGVLF